MKQTLQTQQETITLERSVGNLFSDFLETKNRLGEYQELSKLTIVSIDGEFIRTKAKGFPSKVSQILKMVILPSQKLRFHPAVAGG